MNLGEISTIRDILMGQQMEDYERRFQAMEEKMAEMVENLEAQIDSSNNQSLDQKNQLEKSLTDQLNQLDDSIGKRLDALEQALQQTSKADKAKIGQLLTEIGQKLIEG